MRPAQEDDHGLSLSLVLLLASKPLVDFEIRNIDIDLI